MRSGLVVCLCACALASSAPAAHADPEFHLGGFIGFGTIDDRLQLGSEWVDRRDTDTAPLGGLRASVVNAPSEWWTGETRVQLGLEAELSLSPVFTTMPSELVSLLGWRAHGMAGLGSRFRAHVVAGVGGQTFSSSADFVPTDTQLEVYWGLGFSVDLPSRMILRIDGRNGYMRAVDQGLTSTFTGQLSIARSFGGRAARPPARQEEPHEEPIAVAPPPPPADSDGDGLTDDRDRCPTLAEIVNGFEDDDGCPEPDPDGDKIYSTRDLCPDEPEDIDTFEDEDGCPELDNDRDGLADAFDKCPLEPETMNGFRDADGCADAIPQPISTALAGVALVQFQRGSPKFAPGREELLHTLAAVMVGNKDLKVALVAHPEDDGDRARALAQKRVDRVKWFLVEQGPVEMARITTEIAATPSAKGAAIDARLVVDVPGGAK